jgi:hypothetical protein
MLLLSRSLLKLNNDTPADLVIRDSESDPLWTIKFETVDVISLATRGRTNAGYQETIAWGTHGIRSVAVSNDERVLRLSVVHTGVFGRVKGISGSNQRDISFLGVGRINLWKETLFLKGFVQGLSDTTMSSVSTDEDVSFSNSSILEINPDSHLVLLVRDQLLGKVNLVGRDLAEEHVVQGRSGKQDSIISNSGHKKEKKRREHWTKM